MRIRVVVLLTFAVCLLSTSALAQGDYIIAGRPRSLGEPPRPAGGRSATSTASPATGSSLNTTCRRRSCRTRDRTLVACKRRSP